MKNLNRTLTTLLSVFFLLHLPQMAQAQSLKSCSANAEALGKELKELDSKTEEWAKSQSTETLSSPNLEKTKEGRSVLLFSAHSLPDDRIFVSATRDCWAAYLDFRDALEARPARPVAEVNQAAKGWRACLAISETGVVSEATDILDCWKQLSEKKSK